MTLLANETGAKRTDPEGVCMLTRNSVLSSRNQHLWMQACLVSVATLCLPLASSSAQPGANAPTPPALPTAVEFYAELPYRVSDEFTSGDGYLRAHLVHPWFVISP